MNTHTHVCKTLSHIAHQLAGFVLLLFPVGPNCWATKHLFANEVYWYLWVSRYLCSFQTYLIKGDAAPASTGLIFKRVSCLFFIPIHVQYFLQINIYGSDSLDAYKSPFVTSSSSPIAIPIKNVKRIVLFFLAIFHLCFPHCNVESVPYIEFGFLWVGFDGTTTSPNSASLLQLGLWKVQLFSNGCWPWIYCSYSGVEKSDCSQMGASSFAASCVKAGRTLFKAEALGLKLAMLFPGTSSFHYVLVLTFPCSRTTGISVWEVINTLHTNS